MSTIETVWHVLFIVYALTFLGVLEYGIFKGRKLRKPWRKTAK